MRERKRISKYILQKEDCELESVGSEQDIVTKAYSRNKPVDYIKVTVFPHYITISFSNMTTPSRYGPNIPATRRHRSANATTINTQNATQTNLATRYTLSKNILQFEQVGKHLQQLLVCVQSANSLSKCNMADKTNRNA
jgi:hypothetical protein